MCSGSARISSRRLAFGPPIASLTTTSLGPGGGSAPQEAPGDWRTRRVRATQCSGAVLVGLGQGLDLGEDRVPDQANERDAETVDVEKAAPGLAQEDDAQHHQPYAAGLKISRAQLSKCHPCTRPSK